MLFHPGAEAFNHPAPPMTGNSVQTTASWTVPAGRTAFITNATQLDVGNSRLSSNYGPICVAGGTTIKYSSPVSGLLLPAVDTASRAQFETQTREYTDKIAALTAAVQKAAVDALKGAALELFTSATVSSLRENPEALWKVIAPRVDEAIQSHLGGGPDGAG
jgi:hypothetical protein